MPKIKNKNAFLEKEKIQNDKKRREKKLASGDQSVIERETRSGQGVSKSE